MVGSKLKENDGKMGFHMVYPQLVTLYLGNQTDNSFTITSFIRLGS